MNDAIILQHCLSTNAWTGKWAGIFYDQLRLTMARHSAYARAHHFDYAVHMGDIHAEQSHGAWGKIWLLLDAMQRGYEYAVWLDTDAAVMNFSADLRHALPEGALIGAVIHDPDRSPFLKSLGVPRHYNVGVLYVRNDPRTVDFLTAWANTYPGHERWAEQGVFNQMAEGNPHICAVDDRWNSTINVNEIDDPVVRGWHGIMPPEHRLEMMVTALSYDYAQFRVR